MRVLLTLSLKIYFECCGMQLRSTPAERECKEKLLNRKIQREKKEFRITDCIEVPSAAWLNIIIAIML
jgi:hypothetical protein